jgi:hypothetical protein
VVVRYRHPPVADGLAASGHLSQDAGGADIRRNAWLPEGCAVVRRRIQAGIAGRAGKVCGITWFQLITCSSAGAQACLRGKEIQHGYRNTEGCCRHRRVGVDG